MNEGGRMSEITKINAEIEIRDISPLICELRGQAVMLDRDLAELYHVMTGRMIGPQIVTNFHKLVCADMCRAAANRYCF